MNKYDSHRMEYIGGILDDLLFDIPTRTRMTDQFRERSKKNLTKCIQLLKQVDSELSALKEVNMSAKTDEDMSD